MPGGSSFIYGVFPCSEPRYIFDSKPRTITVDAEVYLGRDAHEKVNVLNAVVHYYVPSGETPPRGADYYLIGGRVASVADDTPVGEGYSTKDYDVEIEAIFLHVMPSSVAAVRPIITVAGQAGAKVDDRKFKLDINQYVSGETRLNANICYFSVDNKRFKYPPVPRPSSYVSVTGYLYAEAFEDKAGVRRLQIEINDIAFLNSETSTTPIKGKAAKLGWGGRSSPVSPTPKAKSTRKRAHESDDASEEQTPPKTRRRMQSNAEASSSQSKGMHSSPAKKSPRKASLRNHSEAGELVHAPSSDNDGGSNSSAVEILEVTPSKKGKGKARK